MKINPLEWNEVKGDEIEVPSGLLLLRSAQAFSVLVVSHGVEIGIGFSETHKIRLKEAGTAFLRKDKGQKVFIKRQLSRVVSMTGRKFTNIDRLPQESGSVDAVTAAVRLLELRDRARVRSIREKRELDALVEQIGGEREAARAKATEKAAEAQSSREPATPDPDA